MIIGQWGLVCLDKEDRGKIVISCNGSPILVGYDSENNIYLASE